MAAELAAADPRLRVRASRWPGGRRYAGHPAAAQRGYAVPARAAQGKKVVRLAERWRGILDDPRQYQVAAPTRSRLGARRAGGPGAVMDHRGRRVPMSWPGVAGRRGPATPDDRCAGETRAWTEAQLRTGCSAVADTGRGGPGSGSRCMRGLAQGYPLLPPARGGDRAGRRVRGRCRSSRAKQQRGIRLCRRRDANASRLYRAGTGTSASVHRGRRRPVSRRRLRRQAERRRRLVAWFLAGFLRAWRGPRRPPEPTDAAGMARAARSA